MAVASCLVGADMGRALAEAEVAYADLVAVAAVSARFLDGEAEAMRWVADRVPGVSEVALATGH